MTRHRIATVVLLSIIGVGCGGDEAPASPERVVTSPVASAAPVEIGGRLWAIAGEQVVELDPVSLQPGRAIDVPGLGGGALELEDGALWMRGAYGTALLDTVAGEVVAANERTYDSLATVGGRLFGTGDGDLYEIDPATAADLGQVSLPPNDNGFEYEVVWTPLVALPDTLWVTVGAGGWQFSAFDPATGRITDTVGIEPSMIAAVLVGDRIWLADRHGEVVVVDATTGDRVDVDVQLPVGETILDEAGSLFAGPDGSLWLLDQPSQVVTQLDPHTGDTIGSFHLTWRPSAMTVTATELWITNPFDDRLTVVPRSALQPAG